MSTLMRFLIESIAIGSLSMLIGRSRLFRAFRWWVGRERPKYNHELAFDLIKCPWCLSFWFALPLAIYTPLGVTPSLVLNTLITWLAMVAVAPLAGGVIYLCYGFLPPVPSEAEWEALKYIDEDEIETGEALSYHSSTSTPTP